MKLMKFGSKYFKIRERLMILNVRELIFFTILLCVILFLFSTSMFILSAFVMFL